MMFRNKAKILLRWAAVLCLLGFVSVWPLAVEAAKVQYLLKSWNGPALRVFVTRPVGLTPDRPVVVVMHGMNRDAVK
jgi:poly(3-hydroxybutyrate) depolymerase